MSQQASTHQELSLLTYIHPTAFA